MVAKIRYFFPPSTQAPPAGRHTHLFAIVSDWGQDGPESLEAHGDVQQVSSEEEVVKVSKNGHGGVPDQIQEVLQPEEQNSSSREIIFRNIKIQTSRFLMDIKQELQNGIPKEMWKYETYVVSQNYTQFPGVVLGINGAQPVHNKNKELKVNITEH